MFFKHTVVLCHCPELFHHLLLFYVNYSPQQTSAVKTFPLYTPISLVLSFLFFSNEFPIQFLRTNQISFSVSTIQLDLHVILQFMFFRFSLYIFSKHHHHTKNQYSPTANIITYLDPGTMLQQNPTIIISKSVLETVSSSQFTNHPFIPGYINPNLSNTLFPGFPNSPFFIFMLPRN